MLNSEKANLGFVMHIIGKKCNTRQNLFIALPSFSWVPDGTHNMGFIRVPYKNMDTILAPSGHASSSAKLGLALAMNSPIGLFKRVATN